MSQGRRKARRLFQQHIAVFLKVWPVDNCGCVEDPLWSHQRLIITLHLVSGTF